MSIHVFFCVFFCCCCFKLINGSLDLWSFFNIIYPFLGSIFFQQNYNIFLISPQNICCGAHQKLVSEPLLLRIHNICFFRRCKRILRGYPLLSRLWKIRNVLIFLFNTVVAVGMYYTGVGLVDLGARARSSVVVTVQQVQLSAAADS